MSAPVWVAKTGARGWAWEARCRQHPRERTYFTGAGAVALNTRGVGNRTWGLAMLAALEHVGTDHLGDPA